MLSVFSDSYFMKQALAEAEQLFEAGEIPVGAVITCDNRIIARTHNQTEQLTDVTAHAEILAITAASGHLGSKYLQDCTLFVTLEPCVMCAGALAWSQIGRVVYGASDEKRGFMLFGGKSLLHPKTRLEMGIMEHECGQLMTQFFKIKTGLILIAMYDSAYLPSPIGLFKITGSALGVRRVNLAEKQNEIEFSDLPDDHPVAQCCRQLEEYFKGKRQEFDLRLDWSGESEFNRQVWAALLEIPYGKTASYSDIAEQMGHPTAVAAVGLANRNNPIAIVVPCHRVIGKAGELRGYFYGLDTKMELLRLENPVRFAVQGSLF